jgi:hypothetical protein
MIVGSDGLFFIANTQLAAALLARADEVIE